MPLLGAWCYAFQDHTNCGRTLIKPLGGNQFLVQVAEYGANLSGIMNPVTVALTIGDDTGTTSVNAIIK